MSPTSLRTILLAATATYLCGGPLAKSETKAGVTTAHGVFLGRSGKPMAKTRLILAEVAGDQEVIYAKIKLAINPPITITDDQGRFQFTGLTPGLYCALHQPSTASKVLPAEINIKALAAVKESPFPLLHDVQLGDTGAPNPERVWGKTFTRMTLMSSRLAQEATQFLKARWWPAPIQRQRRRVNSPANRLLGGRVAYYLSGTRLPSPTASRPYRCWEISSPGED